MTSIIKISWNKSKCFQNLGITGSLRGLRDRIGSFEMPGVLNMPKSINIPRSVNINFPSNFSSDWNLRVRISKFSRKWFYGCADNPSNVDEYQIRNENGRVVITPVQEKKAWFKSSSLFFYLRIFPFLLSPYFPKSRRRVKNNDNLWTQRVFFPV